MVLALGPEGSPELKIPKHCSLEEAHRFLEKNQDWLVERLRQNFLQSNRENKYVDCGRVRFLGKLYQLRLVDSRQVFRISGDILFLKRPSKECSAKIERVVVKWYRDEMELLIPERIERINQYFDDPIAPRSVKYRKMKSSYGNCSKSGVITLNVMLMKTQLENIDYVIAHELCHLRCWPHDFEFYSCLNSVMADWKARARSLEKDF
ncbi:MAG: SprT-like domain-containing protein [Pseudomonadota bacterium]|nr:SprT-like domain-containing protein [Pseudomonadota bacterium]